MLADAIDEKTASRSLPALSAVIRDLQEAPILRGAAANLLGQRFPSDAPAILMPLVGDHDQLVRAKVIEGLGHAQARSAADVIAPYLSDPSLHVRQTAALVLASFGDSRGERALKRLTSDPKTRALVRPHVMLGIGAANRVDFQTAKHELEVAVTEMPYLTDALVFLADIHVRQGDAAGARKYLEEALRYNPQQRGAISRLKAMGAR